MQRAARSSRLSALGGWRAGGRAFQAAEHPERRGGTHDHRPDHHLLAAVGTREAIHPKDVPEQVAPRPAPACPGASPPLGAFRQPAPAGFRLGSRGHDLVPPCRGGPKDAVIQHHIGVRRWNESGEALHQRRSAPTLALPPHLAPIAYRQLDSLTSQAG